MEKFELEVLITEAAQKTLNDGIIEENVGEITELLSQYIPKIKSINLKREFSYGSVDLVKYGCEKTNYKTYSPNKCIKFLEKLSSLAKPVSTCQF